MRSEEDTARAAVQYADTVRRICMLHLKNQTDTEDVFQTVLIKYALSTKQFESPEHEKARIIRVTINACRDWLRDFFRRHTIPMEHLSEIAEELPADYSDVWEAVLSLPSQYRDVVYLFYYEQYTAVEIGRILGKNVNTVYTLLSRAKNRLRESLGGEYSG